MRYLLIIMILIINLSDSFADMGKLVLKNGKVFEGDFNRSPDGNYWLYVNKCMIKFTKDEISKTIIYSRNEHENKTAYNLKAEMGKLNVCKEDTKYDEIISYAARKHNLDPALIKAVVKAESNFNVRNLSCKGACGLMQLMPDTAKGLGVKDSYEPKANIYGGTKYLRYMLELFDWDLEKALAAYNAGPKAVLKYHDVPPYDETRGYIKKVYKNYQDYRYSNKIYTYTDESGKMNIYNIKRKR
ncbi:MAG: lytic transglycosylase domain-containing protein [Elusimicrobia bacterium]|nr:lytic transglycosylase domain-containing protein [Candidatus Liberimonas magnetica]